MLHYLLYYYQKQNRQMAKSIAHYHHWTMKDVLILNRYWVLGIVYGVWRMATDINDNTKYIDMYMSHGASHINVLVRVLNFMPISSWPFITNKRMLQLM